jgi:biopolymer transport protein ExbB/TolQ
VGLVVAIPAVIAYNIFQGRVRRTLGRVDAMAHLILARARDEAQAEDAKADNDKAGKGK